MPMVSMCLNYYTGAYMQISGLDLFMEARPSVRLGTAPYSVCCQKVERCVSLRWFLFLAYSFFRFHSHRNYVILNVCLVSCVARSSRQCVHVICRLAFVSLHSGKLFMQLSALKTFLVHKLCFCDVFLCFFYAKEMFIALNVE